MNNFKPKPLLYSHLPRFKGKYKSDSAQIAIKRLSYIKHLRFTKIHEYVGWSLPASSNSLKRLFKLCKTFKTVFDMHSALQRSLKMSRINRLSIVSYFNSGMELLKRVGNRGSIEKLTLRLTENVNQAQLKKHFAILRKKRSIADVKFRFPRKPMYDPTQKQIDQLTKTISKIKGLNSIKFDTNYFMKFVTVKTIFKPLLSWNISILRLYIDLRAARPENLALALSNLASMKTLRIFEMQWGYLDNEQLELDNSQMNEVIKSFKVFLKNQTRLNLFSFTHHQLHGTCSLVEVYQGIGKLKTLESLILGPYSGEWTEKDIDAFIVSLSGHPKLQRLEITLNEFPAKLTDQFNKKLSAGLHAIKKIEKVKIVGIKMPGITIEDPVLWKDLFKHVLKLEFALSLRQNNANDATSFSKVLSTCTQIEELVLSVNQTAMATEQALAVILTAIGNLENLKLLDLTFGKVKREGNKNIFSQCVTKLLKLWCLKLKFGESYFTEEEIINLSECLIVKKFMRSVVITGNFQSIAKNVKDFFVMNLRTQGIKTPPLV